MEITEPVFGVEYIAEHARAAIGKGWSAETLEGALRDVAEVAEGISSAASNRAHLLTQAQAALEAVAMFKFQREHLHAGVLKTVTDTLTAINLELAPKQPCGHTHYFGNGSYVCELPKGHTGRHGQRGCSWDSDYAHVPSSYPNSTSS